MKTNRSFLLLALIFLHALSVVAEDSPIRHRILFFEYGKGPNRLVELDESGKVIWEHRPPSIAVIFEVLPNGNVLVQTSPGIFKRHSDFFEWNGTSLIDVPAPPPANSANDLHHMTSSPAAWLWASLAWCLTYTGRP
jgi:hypothetical protein